MQSVLVMYDREKITEDELVTAMVKIEKALDHRDLKVPSRLIKLPIAFDDASVLEAVERYSVRANTEFLLNVAPSYTYIYIYISLSLPINVLIGARQHRDAGCPFPTPPGDGPSHGTVPSEQSRVYPGGQLCRPPPT